MYLALIITFFFMVKLEKNNRLLNTYRKQKEPFYI